MAHLRVRPFKAGLSPAEAGSIMEGQGERGPEGPHYPNRQNRTTGTGRAALPELAEPHYRNRQSRTARTGKRITGF
jgi:hypothetical protein